MFLVFGGGGGVVLCVPSCCETDLNLICEEGGWNPRVKEAQVVSAIELFLDYMFVMSNGIWLDRMTDAFKVKNLLRQSPITLEDVAKVAVDRTARQK